MDVSQLEPAERDPKKLRSTAIWLVVLMLISAVGVSIGYHQYQKRTAQSDRPTMLTKLIGKGSAIDLTNAEGEVKNIQDLKGKISLCVIVPSVKNEQSRESLEVLRKVQERYEGAEQKPRLVFFVLDGRDDDPSKMKLLWPEFGEGENVWRIAAGKNAKSDVRKFLKNKLRYGVYPEEKEDGFSYDSKIVLLDQHLHVRGVPGTPIGWDFNMISGHWQEYEEAVEKHGEDQVVKPRISLERMEDLLFRSIDYLYANPEEKGQK